MSEQNVEIVRRAYAHFAHGVELIRAGRFEEWETLPEWGDLYAPNIRLEEVAEVPDADTYEGVDGVQRWVRAGLAAFTDVQWQPREFTPRGPHVLVDVRGRFTGAGSGAEVEMEVTHMFTVRDGRIVRITGFLDRAKALEAAEASE